MNENKTDTYKSITYGARKYKTRRKNHGRYTRNNDGQGQFLINTTIKTSLLGFVIKSIAYMKTFHKPLD